MRKYILLFLILFALGYGFYDGGVKAQDKGTEWLTGDIVYIPNPFMVGEYFELEIVEYTTGVYTVEDMDGDIFVCNTLISEGTCEQINNSPEQIADINPVVVPDCGQGERLWFTPNDGSYHCGA